MDKMSGRREQRAWFKCRILVDANTYKSRVPVNAIMKSIVQEKSEAKSFRSPGHLSAGIKDLLSSRMIALDFSRSGRI